MNGETPLKPWLRRASSVLGVLGLAFVAYRLFRYSGELSLPDFGAAKWAMAALLIVAYGAANLFLAVGWAELLKLFGADARLGWCVRTYAVSQIAKYLPGNVFHYAGRQVIGAAEGLPQRALFLASLFELIVISAVAVCFLPLALPVIVPAISQQGALAIAIGMAAIGFAAILSARQPCLRNAVMAYFGQVVVSNSTFLGAFWLAGGLLSGWSDALFVAASFTIAWLAGLMTPGAPAGLGVREAALVFLLSGIAPEPVVLTAALLGRVVTTLGDLGFYVAGRI